MIFHIFDLGRIYKPFRVVFEAYRPIESNGWIALDDISFTNCSLPPTNRICDNSEYRCSRGSCVTQDKKCDIEDNCGDNSDETLAICSSYSK
jgi:hypothetical protein